MRSKDKPTQAGQAEQSAATPDRLRQYLELTGEGFWELNAEGVTVHVNPAMAALLGYAPAAIEGEPFCDYVDSASLERCTRHLQLQKQGETLQFDLDLIARDGTIVSMQAVLSPLFDGQGAYRGALLLMRRADKNAYEDLYLNAPVAHFSVSARDGRIVRCNLRAGRLLGCDASTLVGRQTRELCVPGPHGCEKAAVLLERFRNGEPIESEELLMQRADGTAVWVSVSVEPVHGQDGRVMEGRMVAVDIDSRKRAEEDVRDTQYQMLTAMDGGQADSWALEVDTRRLHFSERWINLLGYGRDDVANTLDAVMELIHPDDLPIARQRLLDYASGVVSVFETQFRLRKKQGGWVWMLARGKVVSRAPDGTPSRLAGTFFDITNQKQVEAALMRSRALFGSIFNAISDALVLTDTGGHVWMTNPAFTRLFGYTLGDVKGLAADTLYGDGGAFARRVTAETEIAQPVSLRHRAKDGRYFSAESLRIPVHDAQHGLLGYLDVHRDITHRTESEEYLKILASLLDATPASISVHDEAGNFLYVNRRMLELHGYGPEELAALNVPAIDVPEDRAVYEARVQALIEKGEASFEVSHICKDGSLLPMWVTATVAHWRDRQVVLSVGTDLRERRQAEEALRESEERYRVFLESCPSGVMALQDGRFVYANPAACAFLGRTHDEIIGLPALEAIHPDSHEEVLRRIALVAEGQTNPPREIKVLRKDGQVVYSHSVSAPILLTGQPAVLVIANDVSARKQAEEALRERDAQYRRIVETANEGIWTMDGQFRTTYVNSKMAQMLGYTCEEMLGRTVDSFMFDEAALDHGQRMERRRQGESDIYERCFRRKDGGQCWCQVSATALTDEAGAFAGSFAMFTEITERKQAEQALRDTRDYLEKLIHSANAPIVVWSPECIITRVNRAFERLTGQTAASLCGAPIETIFPERERAIAMGRLHKAAEGASREPVETHVLHQDGEVRTVLWSLAGLAGGDDQFPAGTVAQGIDITQLRRAESALRRSEMQFRNLVDMAPVPIFIQTNQRFTYLNNAALQAFGAESEEDLLGKPVLERIDFDYQARVSKRPGAREGLQAPLVEEVYLRLDGTPFSVDAAAVSYTYLGSDGLLVFFRDITERKRAEEDREKLENQLRQAQKMEAVGQLAGGVAHDFNNLLLVILGYIDLIEGEPDIPYAHEIAQIRDAARRAADLTKQLLAFSRRQVMQLTMLNINDVIEGTLKMVRRVLGEHIELCFMPGGQLGSVRADQGQIEQVVMNLCVNSRDAMPAGGRLLIETENVVVGDSYRRQHPWAHEGRYVLLSVTDNGIGMDEATIARIFDPFFTTKEVGQGTGLGLATVYGIIQQHDGLIHVYSEPGKGTTFKIYLPMVERAAESVGTKIEPPALGGTETILLAEDEPPLLDLVTRMLNTAGYHVLAAHDGEEAIRMYDAHADEISLALLDVIMPRMSGRAVMEHIRERNPDMRFLFSSGYSENALHTGFVLQKGLRLLRKPYRRSDLLRAIREVLDSPEQP